MSTVSHQAIPRPTLDTQIPFPIALAAPSGTSTPTVSHQAITQPTPPVVQAPSPGIAFQEVSPDHGPISGGEKILLVGSGFSEGQDLLVRFGAGATPVMTELVNPHNLRCILPPTDSPRCVSVTLHRQDRSKIQHEIDVNFTYKGAEKDLSVRDDLVSVWC